MEELKRAVANMLKYGATPDQVIDATRNVLKEISMSVLVDSLVDTLEPCNGKVMSRNDTLEFILVCLDHSRTAHFPGWADLRREAARCKDYVSQKQ